jgi:hypothetical protein
MLVEMTPLPWPYVSPPLELRCMKTTRDTGLIRTPATGWRWTLGADIFVMVHPDYQYTRKLIAAIAAMIGNGLYDYCVIEARILGGYALRRGMPLWKYLANRFLTLSADGEVWCGNRGGERDSPLVGDIPPFILPDIRPK